MKHPQLGHILGWKHNHEPGIETTNGTLNKWPASLGAFPSDVQLQAWVDEWEALPADNAGKDARAALLSQLQAATTIAQLKQLIAKVL